MAHSGYIAKVAVENTAYSFDMLFSYLIPDSLIQKAKTGCRVLVGFGTGNKKRLGFIFEISDDTDEDFSVKKLKPRERILDDSPFLGEDVRRLAKFISDRTFCTFYDSAKAMLPFGLGFKAHDTYSLTRKGFKADEDELTAEESRIRAFFRNKKGSVKYESVEKNLGIQNDSPILEGLISKGYVQKNVQTLRNASDAVMKTVKISDAFLNGEIEYKLTAKQKSVISLLEDIGSAAVKEITYFTDASGAVIENLTKKGILDSFETEVYRNPLKDGVYITDKTEIVLSNEQNNAYDILKKRLDSEAFHTSLLYGVTGSGKTKVYMKLIDSLYKTGKSVIVTVPEISLTPQLLSQFYSRYGEEVAVMHSGLSVGERLDEFKRIKRGRAHIVVGTRSAVFAPAENLALIVIDEEQESSYKSERTPRYHAREAAKFRCADSHALLILASATPSVESFALAKSGKYELIELKNRYSNSVLPEVKVVDMTDRRQQSGMMSLSLSLCEEIKYNLENKQQTILLINRRGYNTFVACKECKSVVTCPNCSISLTYHIANNRLMCHYCGYSEPMRTVCSKCGSETVRYSGFGTQKVEQEINSLFPEARILRIDADTMTYKNSHEKKFGEFADGKYDIMVGTQMVAKGLNFPNVTLVGVVSVDQQLYNDDFRSMEKAFDLLTQVVGRSGRGDKLGRAVIQTVVPDNPVIRFASRQDYLSFYNDEIAIRRGLIYPPFCDICVISFTSSGENYSHLASVEFLDLIKKSVRGEYSDLKLIILGPVEPKLAKINNKYRERIIIKCKNTKKFRNMISRCLRDFSKISRFSRVTVSADMNPESTF